MPEFAGACTVPLTVTASLAIVAPSSGAVMVSACVLTVTLTGADVVLAPALSVARAVNV